MKSKTEKRMSTTMGNGVTTAKRLYHQKYRKEWEKIPSYSSWLRSSNEGYTAHCKACGVDILARLASIKQHENTVKHQNGMKCNQVLLNHLSIVKDEDEQLSPIPDEEILLPTSKEEEDIPVKRTIRVNQLESIPPYKYRKEWEDNPSFATWLQPTEIDYMAHCRICSANVLARIASIKQHENTTKHQNAVKFKKFYTNCTPKEEDSAAPAEEHEARRVKIKSKAKPQSIHKQVMEVEHIEFQEDNENMSNDDSILDTLLDTDDMATYSTEEDPAETEEQQEDQDDHDEQQVFYVEDMKMNSDELHEDAISHEEQDEDPQIINEFDLFGKSVALQLNQMDLEDALLCQDRLQAVITNFRLRVLKRQRQNKSPASRKS